jgi:hypothetical protein
VNFHTDCAKILSPMKNVEPTLLKDVLAKPHYTFRVIVRVQGDLAVRQEQLEAVGFSITRPLRLVHGYSATAPGTAIQRARGEEWILSIEGDGEMWTMDGNSK